MSWNNVLPWFIYELEYEHKDALMSGAMPEEYNSGKTRSYPEHWFILDKNKPDRQIYSLGVRIK